MNTTKNPNILSYLFMLTQQKLKSMNLETIRQLALQFRLDPNQNLSYLISELSQILVLQTVGSQSQNMQTWGANSNENMQAYIQTYNEILQKYLFFSNIEKNYYNLLMSNTMRANGVFPGSLDEKKRFQGQMMMNGLPSAKLSPSMTKPSIPFDLPKIQDLANEKSCICNNYSTPIKENLNKTIQCSNPQCKSIFHEKCINFSPSSDHLECPKCVLSSLDPFNRVVTPISDYFFVPNQNENLIYDFVFFLSQEQMKAMIENPNLGVEIRSVRLNSKELHETTWIDYGEVFLNNAKIQELVPLNVSISLKKRKDEKIFLRENLNVGINFIKVVTKKITPLEKNQFKFCENAKHLIAVYLVEKQSWSQVRNNICVLDEGICQQKVMKKFILNSNKGNSEKNSDDAGIKVDKITITMTDTLDLNLIESPARGIHCDHLQCFSLENYLKMMENSFPRKFRCPICKARCYNLYIDGYFLRILNEARKQRKNFTEITFLKDGSYHFNENSTDKECGSEEIKNDEVFNYDEFCWNSSSKNDSIEIQPSTSNKKISDVIIIEDEENIGDQPLMPEFFNPGTFDQAPFLIHPSNNVLTNQMNEFNLLKMKQLQMQMQMQNHMQQNPLISQQQCQPNVTNAIPWNESLMRNQVEMERFWHSMQHGYFRK